MSDWKTIKTFSNRPEAEIVKGILEANGIAAIVRGDDSGGMRPSLSFASGVDLQVQEKDIKKAQGLIQED